MGSHLSDDLASLKIQRDVDPERGSALRWAIPLVVVIALGAGGAAVYPKVKAEIFKAEIAITEVALISPAQASITVTSTGYVVPQSLARPGAKIPGRLARVLVKEGDVVKAGQTIAELDDAEARASVASAEARAAAARARADAARANIAEIQQQLEREKTLVDKGVNGRALLEDLTARLRAQEAAARASAVEAKAAQAEVESLRVLLRDRTIVAPIDGTIVTRPPQPGDLVGPEAPILEVADFRTLMVETEVPEGRLHLVKIGAPCEIVLDAYPSKRWRGAAVEVGKRINRAKASVIVKVKFVDATEGVLPEMAARVSFLEQEVSADAMKEPPKLVVPASAVAERGGAKVVFAVDQGKVRMVPVTLGGPVGSGFELTGPGEKGREAALAALPPGTRIVDKPGGEISDGHKVKEREKD